MHTLLNKVCILTSVHFPFDVRIFYKQALTLKIAKYDVTLIAQGEKSEIVSGIKIVGLPKPQNRLERMTKTVWQLYRYALKSEAQVFHIHDPELMPVAFMLKLRGKNVVYDMHENLQMQILHKIWIHERYRKLLSKLFHVLEILFLSRIPVIFAEHSYSENHSWVKQYETILNMPDLTKLTPMRTEFLLMENISIGYMGVVEVDRGSVTTINALKILKESGIEPIFECIGPSEQIHMNILKQLCKNYSLNKVKFYGQIPAHFGWPIISRCKIGLAVLNPLPNYLNSYPTKMFEYMAMGIPVIVSNFPLYKKIVESARCGICVNPQDPNELAAAIKYLIKNPTEAHEMGINGYEAVRDSYNWGNEARKLLKFYDRII